MYGLSGQQSPLEVERPASRHGGFPPTFDDFCYGRARLYEVHIKNLEPIREACKSILTLKLSLPSDCAICLSQNKH